MSIADYNEEDQLSPDEQKSIAASQMVAAASKPLGPMPQPSVPVGGQSITRQMAPPPSTQSITAGPLGGMSEMPTPLAPRPAEDAAASLGARGPSLYAKDASGQPMHSTLVRGLGHLADIAAPGLAARISGTASNFPEQEKQAEEAAATERSNITSGEQERQSNAAVEHEGAQTESEKTGSELVPLPGSPDEKIMRKNLATPATAIINNEGKDTRAAQTNTTNLRKLGLDEQGNPIPSEQLTPAEQQKIGLDKSRQDLSDAETQLAKFRADPNSPMYKMAQQRMALAQQGYDLRLKEFGFNYEPSTLTPAEQSTLPTDVAGNAVGLRSPLKPGATTVSAAQRASNVVNQLPRLRQQILSLTDQLGPIPGRWNRFWQGDVGVADPQFAKLSDDMDFAASAVALAHAYGRLPSSISEKFDKMYQAGKQDPKNMLAALDVAQEWLPKIMQGGETVGEKSGATSTVSKGPGRFGDFAKSAK